MLSSVLFLFDGIFLSFSGIFHRVIIRIYEIVPVISQLVVLVHLSFILSPVIHYSCDLSYLCLPRIQETQYILIFRFFLDWT